MGDGGGRDELMVREMGIVTVEKCGDKREKKEVARLSEEGGEGTVGEAEVTTIEEDMK